MTDDGRTLPVASDAPGRVSPIVGPTDPRGGSAEQLPTDQPIGVTAAQQALVKIAHVRGCEIKGGKALGSGVILIGEWRFF